MKIEKALPGILALGLALCWAGCTPSSQREMQSSVSSSSSQGEMPSSVSSSSPQGEIPSSVSSLSSQGEISSSLPEEQPPETQTISVSGDAGTLSLTLGMDWRWEELLEEKEEHHADMVLYGLRFSPPGEEGYLEVGYLPQLGLCGTGLETFPLTVAGREATMGVYDSSQDWSFLHFPQEKLWVFCCGEDWLSRWEDEVMAVLDTLEWEPAADTDNSPKLSS